jgi:ABC-2 type transport system ATP-binding protein
VGDELFQRKCLDRVRQFQREGRTILLVTHSADMVRQICGSAAVLDEGHLVALGPPGEAIRAFREHLLQRRDNAEARLEAAALAHGDVTDIDDNGAAGDGHGGREPAVAKHGTRSGAVRITGVQIEYPADNTRRYLCPGEPLTLHIGYDATEPVEDLVAGVAAYSDEGKLLFAANNIWYPIDHGVLNGPGEFLFEFPSVPLLDGTYSITVGLTTADEGTVYDWHELKYRFEVMNPTRASGLVHMPPRISLRSAQGRDVSVSQTGSVREVRS